MLATSTSPSPICASQISKSGSVRLGPKVHSPNIEGREILQLCRLLRSAIAKPNRDRSNTRRACCLVSDAAALPTEAAYAVALHEIGHIRRCDGNGRNRRCRHRAGAALSRIGHRKATEQQPIGARSIAMSDGDVLPCRSYNKAPAPRIPVFDENLPRFVDAFHRKEFLCYENCALRLVPRRSRRSAAALWTPKMDTLHRSILGF
jgi:hypothetical protein